MYLSETDRKRASRCNGVRIRYFFIDYIIYHIFPDFSNRFPQKILKTNDFFSVSSTCRTNLFRFPDKSVISKGKIIPMTGSVFMEPRSDSEDECGCIANGQIRIGTADRADPDSSTKRIWNVTGTAAPDGPPRRRCSGRNPQAGRGPGARCHAPRGRSYRDRR